jgi:hypothetical protein
MVASFRRWGLSHDTRSRRRAFVTRLQQLSVLAFTLLTDICYASVVLAQTTLVRGIVRAPISPGDTTAPWFANHVVTIERVDTGEPRQTVTSRFGAFEFQGLPPGRYRLTVPGVGGWIVWSGKRLVLRGYRSGEFVLQEGRPLSFEIELIWVNGDNPLASTPLTGRAMPLLSLVETCQTARLPGGLSGHEVWGAARLPDGQPAVGIPVHIEPVSEGDALTADHVDVQTRTTSSGCFGLAGLWPGRYRVYVDHAPFTFDAEVDLRETSVARRDITLSAPPENARPQPLRSAWYPRLGIRADTIAALSDAFKRAEPVQRQAVHDGTANPDDMVRMGGAVIWRYQTVEWRMHYRVPNVRVVFEDEGSGQQWEATTALDGSYELYIPQGRYRVRIDHPPFVPLSARLLALPEGFAVFGGFKTPRSSGLYPPRAARRTGLMAALNVGLVLPVDERTQAETDVRDTHPVVHAQAPGSASLSAAPLASRFDQTALDQPLTSGRTVQALLGAVPGVVITESVGTLAQVSAIGQRRFANRLTVDGASADLAVNMNTPTLDEAASGTLPAQATSGGTQTLVPFSAVEEITIRTANTSPEFAQTPGAQTAIVTRAGSDRRTGQVLFEFRPRRLAASDHFPTLSGQPRRFSARNGAASFGGPLWRGRLFYFGALEGQQIERPYAATVSVPSASLRENVSPAVRSILNAFPMPNGRDLGDGLAEYSHAFPISSSLGVVSLRTDANLGMRHHFFSRINVGTSRGDAVRPPDQRPEFSFQQVESTRTGTATFGLTSAFAATAANELRVNVSMHRGWQIADAAGQGGAADLDLSVVAPRAVDPRVRLTVLPTLNTSALVAAGRTSDIRQLQFQLTDTFTAVRGQHELRLGVDVTHVEASTPAVMRYTYSFASVTQLRDGKPRLFFEERAEARAIFLSFATFAQDTWRLSPRLTLLYGIRYSVTPAPTSGTELTPALLEFKSLPGTVTKRALGEPLWRTSWRDVTPHLFVSYQLDKREQRQTTLRAGWDLVFDEVGSPGASAFGDGPPFISRRVINQAVLPVSLETLHNAPVLTAVEQYAFDKDLERPRTYRWHVGLDRKLGRANRLDLAYVGSAARQLVYRAAFLPPTVSAPIFVFSNEASADYHGMLAQFTHRLARSVAGGASYSWSHAVDTDSGENLLPGLPTTLSPIRKSRASADYDRRHVLRVAGSCALSARHFLPLTGTSLDAWRLDVVVAVKSGAPVTVLQRASGVGSYFVRPDLVDNVPLWAYDANSPTRRRINQEAFRTPTTTGHGTLGRNTFKGSPLRQVDVALSRSFDMGRVVTHLSVDAFNLFNLTNYGPPIGRLDAPEFGMPTVSAADGFGSGSLALGGLVALQQLGGSRSVRLGGRLTW